MGEAFAAAVSADGKLYTWGSSRGGKLGLGASVEDSVSVPRLVAGLASHVVLYVSVGETHAACVTDSAGLAWSWGKGTHGCLGNGSTQDHCEPTPVCSQDGKCDAKQLAGVRFVECGFIYSGAVLEDGHVLMWGDNQHGKLGLGAKAGEHAFPTQLENLPPVKFLSLGSVYAGCVTEDGKLYMWGFNVFGNLGLGHRKSVSVPTLVTALNGKMVSSVGCAVGQINPLTGGDVVGKEGPHTVVVTEDGQLYTCGTCHKGMLGNMKKKTLCSDGDQLTPYLVGSKFHDCPELGDSHYLAGVPIVQAVSASIHTGAPLF
eukprot:TRINITY_DN5276_c0_g1_i3.p1 TRINITY_DN5276_c0_g1~~TRINITY_DN5276_c0_g1_i3.p1  ORF type:complete len:364 (-),score=56.67 TRINITY_DN5276_c0_g1_i3:226-1173(-)